MLIRLTDDYLFKAFRTKRLNYSGLFRQIGRLCKEFYNQTGQNRSAMCGMRVSIDVVVEILKGVLDLIDNKPVDKIGSVNKTEVINNLKALVLRSQMYPLPKYTPLLIIFLQLF